MALELITAALGWGPARPSAPAARTADCIRAGEVRSHCPGFQYPWGRTSFTG